MPRTPEATSPEREAAQAPRAYGFNDAFASLGVDAEQIAQSQVRPASAPGGKLDFGQATKQVDNALGRYTTVAERAFAAAGKHNARHAHRNGGRKIENLAMAENDLPGIDGMMTLVRRRVDARFAAGASPADLDLSYTPEEQLFFDAMEFSALREEQLTNPVDIKPQDYVGSPAGAPNDTYENALNHTFTQLRTKYEWAEAEARHLGNTSEADDLLAEISELDTYEAAFITTPPTIPFNRNAAKDYAEELNNPAGNPASRETALIDQTNRDRAFVKFDSVIKTEMKS